MKSLILMTAICLATVGSAADAFHPKIVDLEPINLFVPSGYDANDEIEVVVDGYLPDTCHKLRSPEVKYDPEKHQVLVQPRAQVFEGYCFDRSVPYTQSVKLGLLDPGQYSLQSRSGNTTEKLVVKDVDRNQPIDNFLYMPVDTVQVRLLETGRLEASLWVRYADTCSRIKEIKAPIHTGKTIQLLPIMELTEKSEAGQACETKTVLKEYRVELPQLLPGRYLLHVRSLNGQSVNQAFDNHWPKN